MWRAGQSGRDYHDGVGARGVRPWRQGKGAPGYDVAAMSTVMEKARTGRQLRLQHAPVMPAGVWPSGPREQPLAASVIASPTQCMRLQEAVGMAWPLVVEFLVVWVLEWLRLFSEEFNLAVRHLQFSGVMMMEQLVMVKLLLVEDDGFVVLGTLDLSEVLS